MKIFDAEKLSTIQWFIAFLGVVLEVGLITFAAPLAETAGTDGWISIILAFFITGGGLYLWLRLALAYKDKFLTEWLQDLLGKPLALLLITGLLIYWFLWVISLNRTYANLIQELLLQTTPIPVLALIALFTAAYAARHGLSPVIRLMELMVPISIVIFFGLLLAILPGVEPERLLPVLGNGIERPLRAALMLSGELQGLVAVVTLVPFLQRHDQAMKTAFLSFGLLMFFLVMPTFLIAIGFMGVETTMAQRFPLLTMTSAIRVPVLERLEGVFAIGWIVIVFLTTAYVLYLLALVIAAALGAKDQRHIVTALIPLLLLGISLPGSEAAIDTLSQIAAAAGLLVIVLLPIPLFGLAKLRGKL